MNFQSAIRSQRPQGFNVKQAFLLGFLLVFSIWFLYQIKYSNFNWKDNHASLQSKLGEEDGAINLGRKVNAGWLSSGGELDSEDRGFKGEGEKKEDGGAGDDELDRNVDERAEEVSFNKDNNYGHENAAILGKKQNEKAPEGQHQKSQSNEEDNPSSEVEGVESVSLMKDVYKKENSKKGNESAKGGMPDDEKGPEVRVKEAQSAEKNHSTTSIQHKDQAVKVNDENKSPTKIEEKIAVQPGEMVSATLPSQSDIEGGVHVFHDENGVSLDAN